MRNVLSGNQRKCAQCGKNFYMQTGAWAYRKEYKNTLLLFCSWSCQRKWEEGHMNQKEKREKIRQAIMDGLSVREISVMLDEDPQKIWYWKDKIRKGR